MTETKQPAVFVDGNNVMGSRADGCESRMAVMASAWFIEFRQRLPWLLHVD